MPWTLAAGTAALALQGYPAAKQYLIEHGHSADEVEAMPVAKVVLLHAVRLYEELGGDHFKWMPAEFRSPKSKAAKGLTNYVVPVGDGALFFSLTDQPVLKQVKDGLSHTIMTIEVDDQHAVIWTKPDDLPFHPGGEVLDSQDF